MQRRGDRMISLVHYKLRTLASRGIRSKAPSVSLSCKPTESFVKAYTLLVQGTYSAHSSKNFVSPPNNLLYSRTLRSQIPQGLPYDYIVSHADNSTPFHAAPTLIREVLRRMTWAAQHVVDEQDINPFNEVLALGYFEGGKMGVGTSSQTKVTLLFLS